MWNFLSSLPRCALMTLVRGYRLLLSPWLGSSCRFEPTCSAYALEALARHGAVVGSCLTAGRLLRCHPFCKAGHDPVPAATPPLFRHFVSPAPCAAGDVSSTPTDKTSP